MEGRDEKVSELLRSIEQPPKPTIEAPKTKLLKKMPDPEMLDAFMQGMMGGGTRVLFDVKEGEFKWIRLKK